MCSHADDVLVVALDVIMEVPDSRPLLRVSLPLCGVKGRRLEKFGRLDECVEVDSHEEEMSDEDDHIPLIDDST